MVLVNSIIWCFCLGNLITHIYILLHCRQLLIGQGVPSFVLTRELMLVQVCVCGERAWVGVGGCSLFMVTDVVRLFVSS